MSKVKVSLGWGMKMNSGKALPRIGIGYRVGHLTVDYPIAGTKPV